MKYNDELEAAASLAVKAGTEIMKIYTGDFSVELKDDKTPLTEADMKSNDIIVSELSRRFDHGILSEEKRDDKSRLDRDTVWIIDPLDGTKEFVKKNGEFTVNIALAYKKQPVLGVVYSPVKGELYWAHTGEGAYIQHRGRSRRIHVSDKQEDLILVMSRSHASAKLSQFIEKNDSYITSKRQAGSSLKGCMVASGEADIYMRYNPTNEWDTCAMHCIVEEAGGIFRQIDNTPLLYNRKDVVNKKGFFAINRNHKFIVNGD
ncbi:MAG: 3'(2'),5'-bisphosphate nucleotidase CysQ [bacterium]